MPSSSIEYRPHWHPVRVQTTELNQDEGQGLVRQQRHPSHRIRCSRHHGAGQRHQSRRHHHLWIWPTHLPRRSHGSPEISKAIILDMGVCLNCVVSLINWRMSVLVHGKVETGGKNVQKIKPGQRVVASSQIVCGKCASTASRNCPSSSAWTVLRTCKAHSPQK